VRRVSSGRLITLIVESVRIPARITPYPTGRLFEVTLAQALRARLRSDRPSGTGDKALLFGARNRFNIPYLRAIQPWAKSCCPFGFGAGPLGPNQESPTAMTKADLSEIYRDYIACLNRQDWPNLGRFVHQDVYRNGQRIELSGYREMLEGDFRAIPDLYFDIDLLVCEPPRVASRLKFDCRPKGILFGLPVNGKKVSFTENVFYEFRDGRIEKVWSVIDKAAIESQL
jgi:predicted ester cyclase